MGVDSGRRSQGRESMSDTSGRNSAGEGQREADSPRRLPTIRTPHSQGQRTPASLAPTDGPQGVASEPSTPLPERRHGNRPQSAPLHHLSGQLLRNIGDHYLCRSTGKTLQVLGDGLEREYYIRKTLSYGDLPLQDSDDDVEQ